MSTVCILVKVALDFFQEEVFEGETFLFFNGSASYLGAVTSPCFYSSYFPFISSTSLSPPQPGDTEAVFSEALLNSWTSSIFFLLLVPGVSCSLWATSRLWSSWSDISTVLPVRGIGLMTILFPMTIFLHHGEVPCEAVLISRRSSSFVNFPSTQFPLELSVNSQSFISSFLVF